jgi:mRNA interferase YafQ
MQRRGKDIGKFKTITNLLVNKNPLSQKHKDHSLIGNYANHRECHIEPDWLLIYRIEKNIIYFQRMGTHADLF